MKLQIHISHWLRQFCFVVILLSTDHVFSQPVANFSATPTSGCAPLTVSFRDNSTGNPTAWNWDLGNDVNSAQQHPTTTFFSPGVYTITLTASNANGSSSIVKSEYITVYDKPSVNFTVSDSSTCIPININFTDLSSTSPGNIISWKWDFDDGIFSNDQNPQHFYNIPGNYNITLKVTNNAGCSSSLTKLAYIKALDSIRTTFGFSKAIKCRPPENIAFINNSIGPGTLNYLWDFGDGGTSTAGIPNHTYLAGGVYSIRLIVKNNLGCKDTVVQENALLINNIQSTITGPDTVCLAQPVIFTNTTTPTSLSSLWNFGDSSTSFGMNTAKSWDSTGSYMVKLLNNYRTCSDSVFKIVTVLQFPKVNFSSNDSGGCKAPLTINFTDLSATGASWFWDFGDGSTSTEQNPTHTYTTVGEYDVTLTVTNAGGCSTNLTKYGFIKIIRPSINVNSDEQGGCIPYFYRPNIGLPAIDAIASYLWDFGNGITSNVRYPSMTYPDIGNHTVKLDIVTIDGCAVSRTYTVKTGTLPFVDFGLTPTVVCPGEEIRFSDSSIPADRWQWKFGDGNTSILQNPRHAYLDSGAYSIRLTAWNNGCSDSMIKSRVITVLPGRARFRPVYNCINKKEVFFKDSSILPESWFWDFGDGNTSTLQNPTHQFANYQDYIVSLTTTYGHCSNKRTQLIKLANEIPDFITSKDSLCKSDSTFFYLSNVNKNNIRKYVWDYGDGAVDTTQADSVHHAYSLPGIYTIKLTVTDIHGCDETVVKPNFIYVFGPKAGFTINAAGGCLNMAVNFTDTSITPGGNNIAQWRWDFGDGQSQTFSAPLLAPMSHVYTATGNYYPFLKIIDSVGCSDSIAYFTPITIYKPVASLFTNNVNTCIADTTVFRNLSSGNGLIYSWSFGDGSFSSAFAPQKRYAANGDYTVKLVATDAYGCKDSMTRTNYVHVKDVVASFTLNDSTGSCTPFQVNFSNTSLNAISQQWNFGDGGFSATRNPVYYYTAPGVYYPLLTTKRSNNCVSTYTRKITVTSPVATLTYTTTEGCAPLNVAFHVSTQSDVSYLWDFNDGNSFPSTDSNVTHSYLLPGNFVPKVILKDTAGCNIPVIGRDTIKLHSSKVNFGVNTSVLCDSATVYFSDSTISGSAVATYTWDFGDGTSSLLRTPSHLYTSPGLFTVRLFIATVFGCQDSAVKTNYIKVVKKPDVSIGGTNAYCGPSSVLMNGNLLNADTSAIRWNWDFNNGSISSVQNPPAQQYDETGSYPVRLNVTNSSGCTDTATLQVIIKPIPNTFAGNDTSICLNTSLQLKATGADFYEWLPATGVSCRFCSEPVATLPNSSTLYVKGRNTAGCEKTDSLHIVVKKPFRLTGLQSLDSVCTGKSIQLNINGAENYVWTPANGLNNTVSANPTATPTISNSYKVVGFDNINCFKDSATIYIKVNSIPSVDAGPDKVLNVGNSITLAPQYAGNIINWLWQPATGLNCSDCPSPIATPARDITYTIRVTNSAGCTATDNTFIKVSCNANNLLLPNAFTPNNDPGNLNEIFYPIGTGIFKINTFKIYNRYGQPVFIKGNFSPNDKSSGWNGFYKGKPAPPGNYLYTIEFICSNNEVVNVSGNILLLR